MTTRADRPADRLKKRLQTSAMYVGSLYGGFSVMADNRSRWRLLQLKLARRRRGSAPAKAVDAVPVRIKRTGGKPFYIRPGSSDTALVAYDFHYRHGRPPEELDGRRLTRIVELGSNIGGTLACTAARYPHARLIGVEPDADNAALARRNVEPWADRCRVIEAAIWDTDGLVTIEPSSRSREEYGLIVRLRQENDPPELPSIRALSLTTVLDQFDRDEPIDYLFMDIEGTEERVLRHNTTWAERVQAIRVVTEGERGYQPEDCARDLERLGFRARVERIPVGAFVVGLR
jgi:FkbM family methyltransferase